MLFLSLVLQSVSVEEHTPTNHCNVYELFIVRASELRNWPSSVLSSQVLVLSMFWDLEIYHCRMARFAVAIIVVVVLTRVVKAIVVVN